jgi:redox-regulated HSP33 family molecular chaperone
MQNIHRTTQLIGRAALVALLAAPALGAQDRWEDRDRSESRDRRRDGDRRLFTWRGTVDDDVRIYMRGGNVRSQVVSGAQRRSVGRVNEVNALPRRDGMVRVELIEGRGRVHVIQQPSASNEYTAIVRIKDAQGGAGSYRIATYFEPVGNGRRVERGRVWDDVGGEVIGGASVFRWSGSVDGDLRIALRRGQVGYQVVTGEQPRNVSARVLSGQLPQGRDGQLSVALRQGRGSVSVIQQPSSYNNYTAIVRVVDHQGGYGYYDFDLTWR